MNKILSFAVIFAIFALPVNLQARQNATTSLEKAQRQAEQQIRHLLEPLLDKYCRDECKLMNVIAAVDVATPDEVSPGFDDVDPKAMLSLEPTSARVKILLDEKIGPVSRSKLIDIVQQYLDTLEYPVKIETQIAHFPQPVGSASKVSELREQITKQFKDILNTLFSKFCPTQCLLANFEIKTEITNPEEAQYGKMGEFYEDGGTAIRLKNISATILVDELLPIEERQNILEMAQLKTNFFNNVNLTIRAIKFPKPAELDSAAEGYVYDPRSGKYKRSIASEQLTDSKLDSKTTSQSDTQNTSKFLTDSKQENKLESNQTSNSNTNNSETNQRQEKFERIEKIERVESGDAVQQELKKFKLYGAVFGVSIIALLIFVALSTYQGARGGTIMPSIHRVINTLTSDPAISPAQSSAPILENRPHPTNDERLNLISKRYEMERLREELLTIYAQNPKIAKHVFTRVLTEDGIEITSKYLNIFGESVVMDMIRDPSLQADINNLVEYFAKNPVNLEDDEKLELIQKLHNRTVASKLVVMGTGRSSNLFDFLAEMDGTQILELIRNESLTVKSIILTQVDPQKRQAIYNQMDEDSRLKLLNELSRIDYLPRDYIFNVANALKRKKKDNPRLNTEALPGSDVLLTLLERSAPEMQRGVIKNLELSNPESARSLKNRLVSVETLRYLRDGQLLEVILSLKHDELLQFLKGAPENIRNSIYNKSPKDLVSELEEELQGISAMSREAYQAIERKILNRMKIMANEGLINLVETNERMLSEGAAASIAEAPSQSTNSTPQASTAANIEKTKTNITKVAGW